MQAVVIILLVIMGIAHSYLGERYILIRLAKRDNLPQVLGGSAFTMGTLRFVWHLITLVWGAMAYLVYVAGHGAVSNDEVLTVIGVTSLVSAAFPLYFTRGRHLSWIGFALVGGLLLASRSGIA